jgi:hypothetical protein
MGSGRDAGQRFGHCRGMVRSGRTRRVGVAARLKAGFYIVGIGVRGVALFLREDWFGKAHA